MIGDEPNGAPSGAVVVDNLEKVESVLREMWRVAVKNSAAAEGADKPLVRISLGTLVAVVDEARAAAAEETIGRLTARRPSRVVLVRWKSPAEGADGAEGADIRATIVPVCHAPRLGGQKICCEYIHLAMGAEAAPLLPGAVTPLLEPDLPALLWWDRAFGPDFDLVSRFRGVIPNLLIDTERPGAFDAAARLRGEDAFEPHDFAWARIENWRRAVAQAFDDRPALAALAQVERVSAVCRAPRRDGDDSPVPPAIGLLLMGWLCAQLKWTVRSAFRLDVDVYRARASSGGREFELRLLLDPRPCDADASGCPYERIEFDCGDSEIRLTHGPETDKIIISVCSPTCCPLRSRVGLALARADTALAAALESAVGADPVYLRALDQALALAGHGKIWID